MNMIKMLVGKAQGFKSKAQNDAVTRHIEAPDKNFVVVLSTGGGKTLVLTMPVLRELAHYGGVTGVTIVVSPLISLRNSQVKMLLASKCFAQQCCMTWQELKKDLQAFRDLCMLPSTSSKLLFLFVTPEAARERKFQDFYMRLFALSRVRRVVVDEAHNIVTAGDDWRPSYARLHDTLVKPNNNLRQRVPFTLLSATIPQADDEFYKSVIQGVGGLGVQDVEVIRSKVVIRKEFGNCHRATQRH